MADEGRAKLAELEARLARVGSELRAALPERARELREAAEQLSVDEASARVHIARLAHRLRGTAATYGAESLPEPAARLEAGAKADDVREVSSATIALAELAEQATRGAPPATASAPDTSTPPPVSGVFVKPLAGVRILAIDDDEATRRLPREASCGSLRHRDRRRDDARARRSRVPRAHRSDAAHARGDALLRDVGVVAVGARVDAAARARRALAAQAVQTARALAIARRARPDLTSTHARTTAASALEGDARAVTAQLDDPIGGQAVGVGKPVGYVSQIA